MKNFNRYNHLHEFYKNKFGERTLKICVDGNFTCPNRDGTLSTKGCIFCSERGSGEHIKKGTKQFCNISSQVRAHLNSYKGQRANKFIVYFQNFTNTYDTIENLKKKYDAALIDNRIIGIEIATRPDCINEEIANLLKSYQKNYYVCINLGLQTSNESTGKLINRHYSNSDFSNAVQLLNKHNIDVVAHIMVGLPNENHLDIKNTVEFINSHNIQGLKIHSTYIVKNTILEEMYNAGKYLPISFENYMENLTYIITHIKPSIIIYRINGDALKNLLVAPEWNIHKKWVLNGLDKILRENDLYQGIYYKKQP